jgi:Putative prokaryotic signal transducing protein
MQADLESVRQELEQRSNEDLALILREHDEEEWIPEVFPIVESILAARGVSLANIPVAEAAGEAPVGQPEGELATVARFFSPALAHGFRMALEEAGISAWLSDESTGASFGVGVGAGVQVRAEDLDAAQQVLESAAPPASQLQSDVAETPCPKCGSTQVTQEVAVRDEEADAGGYAPWVHRCGACGNEWED